MSPIPPEPIPFNDTVCWIWSHEGIVEPRPDNEGPFRTRLFRRTVRRAGRRKLTVHVSADTQYRLWCNGQEVLTGRPRATWSTTSTKPSTWARS